MPLTVSNNPYTGKVTAVGSSGGGVGQASAYSPQASVSPGQASSGSTRALVPTYNPQTVATFNQQAPTNLVPGVTNAGAGSNLLAGGQALLDKYGAPAGTVYAPKLDLGAINAQARAAAQNNVNPYYVASLNQFLSEQATAKAQTEAQTKTNIQNLQDVLKNTNEANAVTGTRTTEDTAQKEADINQTADWRQTDQGGQYDIDRITQAVTQAKSGLTGSGIAAGAAGASQDKFNTTESRQATTDTQDKANAELAKARTFEDLATSNKIAGETETKGETQANVDLTNFLTDQSNKLVDYKREQAKAQAADLAQETQYQNKLAINSFINSISNPAQRAAAVAAYGSLY